MPSARANIIAKFIAQIDTGVRWLSSTRAPAEAASPAIVSSSGIPAATSDPNASTRIARVTGQDTSSDFIMASWLAVLKSLHSTEAPVAATVIPSPDNAARGSFRSSAARTISVGSAPAPASRIAAFPSWLIVIPGCGGSTVAIRESASSSAVALVITC
jgi:hypothetical protein